MHPHIGQAAVRVLENAGWTVTIPTEPLCCGLTWISTGQLPAAKRILRRSLMLVREHVRAGGLVVGLEPSCTAVFRNDAPELLPREPDVRSVAEHTVTLAELLSKHTPGWEPPDLSDTASEAIVQVHCHQHAVLGHDADDTLLGLAGIRVRRVSGCCGLAGNFGYQRGHEELSAALAERSLVPAIQAMPRALVLADGFSCRQQIAQTTGRRAWHLAEVLDREMVDGDR
jgi:Fe-S oxidoreductase